MANSSLLRKAGIKIETMSAPAANAPQAKERVERCCPACGGSGFADYRVADFLHTHTCSSCGLILSSMARRKPKLGQYANVDLRAYLTSVGALRHAASWLSNDEDRQTVNDVAAAVEAAEPTDESLGDLCPVCEEVLCDEDCPLEPVRAPFNAATESTESSAENER